MPEMKSIIRFLKIVFLIGAHGVAIAGVFIVFFVLEKAEPGSARAAILVSFGPAISFGLMAGITIFDLIAWWNFRDADPARRHRIGNILHWGGLICGVLLAVSGVVFALVAGISGNPFWVFNALFAAAVFEIPAFICWRFGRAFRCLLSGR
jgi:hypothetical protein